MHDVLALAWYRIGKPGQALEQAREALPLSPHDDHRLTQTILILALAGNQLRQHDEARRRLAQAGRLVTPEGGCAGRSAARTSTTSAATAWRGGCSSRKRRRP